MNMISQRLKIFCLQEKTQVEMLQKDAKIAQQDKLITHLQCRIAAPKKMVSKLFNAGILISKVGSL